MICSECNRPITDGMSITVHKSNFHPDCAVRAVKKARKQNELDDSRRDEDNEGRTLEPSHASVH